LSIKKKSRTHGAAPPVVTTSLIDALLVPVSLDGLSDETSVQGLIS